MSPCGRQTILITGASRGLGAALAECALEAGHRVGLCSRSFPPLAGGENAIGASLDVADAPALETFARELAGQFGGLDVWINNAAVLAPIGPLATADPAALTRLINTNLLGTIHGSRIFASMLREQERQGVLLNVSSGAARRALAGLSAYCASKAAVERLSECLALEEGPRLRVHSVSPGVIATEMQDSLRSQDEASLPEVLAFRELKDSGALLSPREAAERLLQLALDPRDDQKDVCVDLYK